MQQGDRRGDHQDRLDGGQSSRLQPQSAEEGRAVARDVVDAEGHHHGRGRRQRRQHHSPAPPGDAVRNLRNPALGTDERAESKHPDTLWPLPQVQVEDLLTPGRELQPNHEGRDGDQNDRQRERPWPDHALSGSARMASAPTEGHSA